MDQRFVYINVPNVPLSALTSVWVQTSGKQAECRTLHSLTGSLELLCIYNVIKWYWKRQSDLEVMVFWEGGENNLLEEKYWMYTINGLYVLYILWRSTVLDDLP